jgi:SAM-dependent methyltransferase
MSRESFEPMYQGQPPWDIPGPQPAIVGLEEAGAIQGSVLDAGCGTGVNALYLASRGHEVTGIDVVPVTVERARAKARERGLGARFEIADALELDRLGLRFDSAIDSGLFHVFNDQDRAAYVAGLGEVLRPGGTFHLLCFSDREPPGEGPRRVTQPEIHDAFRDGWEVRRYREEGFERESWAVDPDRVTINGFG